MYAFPCMPEFFQGIGGSEIHEEHEAVQQDGQRRCGSGVGKKMRGLRRGWRQRQFATNKHLSLVAGGALRVCQGREDGSQDRALPFQWCQDIPGGCIRLVHSYSRVLLLSNSKCKRYFCNHLKPAKLIWTAMYRKQQKNVYGDLIRKCKYNDLDIRVEAAKKRHRTTKSPCGLAVNRLWTRH
ncbi:uncharacterized protein LOC119302167 [Triticum dicoccoides]|uniref:uncharacterized protein LOC119302167 n=1 Tax=Triticum dicoccoides TaxID=85692 RepID=UPI00188FEE7B|nr:uncharacterized protein LOC119302167 [Triticum dicoccoides]